MIRSDRATINFITVRLAASAITPIDYRHQPVLKITRSVLIGHENSLLYLIPQPLTKDYVLQSSARCRPVLSMGPTRFYHSTSSVAGPLIDEYGSASSFDHASRPS